ncbi:MAG: AlpA family phage regulatory protein [Alphaproteobacteria bacterium]|nr:AlpA family phage regulatory protein [Alphaproteobacteria bacterium]
MEKRIIRKPELFARVCLSDATIWRLEKAKMFPGRVMLGGKAVGWFSDEVDAWLQQRGINRGKEKSYFLKKGN